MTANSVAIATDKQKGKNKWKRKMQHIKICANLYFNATKHKMKKKT